MPEPSKLDLFKERFSGSSTNTQVKIRVKKIKVPKSVMISWNSLSESMSVWGKIQTEGRNKGKRKWPSKYAHYLIVKKWIEKLPQEDN